MGKATLVCRRTGRALLHHSSDLCPRLVTRAPTRPTAGAPRHRALFIPAHRCCFCAENPPPHNFHKATRSRDSNLESLPYLSPVLDFFPISLAMADKRRREGHADSKSRQRKRSAFAVGHQNLPEGLHRDKCELSRHFWEGVDH